MGLFEDLWDWIKGLVKELIDWALFGVRQWVLNVVDVLISPIKKTIEGIQKYITNVTNALTKLIDNVSSSLTKYIDNVSHSLTKYIDNVSSKLGETLTNAVSNLTKWVETGFTNLFTYIDERLRLWDPTEFLRNPLGYISTAFGNLIQVYVYGAAESLGEGINAGLAGSNPGPEGPGRAFLEGARQAVLEHEERVKNG